MTGIAVDGQTLTVTFDDYGAFLGRKKLLAPSVGFDVADSDLHPSLFPHQRAGVRWAVKKGRGALFWGTGLGKTFGQLEWARLVHEETGGEVLILAPLAVAPLAVAQQTVTEGQKFGYEVHLCRTQADVQRGINITNYEMLQHFDPSHFAGVVLDESGILKAFSGVMKKRIIEAFRPTRYRLACTATPAPNDVVELCNQADFLEVMKPAQMISTFFTPKGGNSAAGQFHLKSHAREHFFEWLASWASTMTKPSDLGFSDEGFELPPLHIESRIIASDWAPEGQLLFTGLKGVTHRAQARKATLEARVGETADLVRRESGERWMLWYGLLEEADRLAKLVPGCVVVRGSDSPERKADVLNRFAAGEIQYLLTHPKIAGLGMNFQQAARMAFVGIGDSFEAYFQCLRRLWRFGQARDVWAYIVLGEVESAVYENVLRKEREHEELMAELLASIRRHGLAELAALPRQKDYDPQVEMALPLWLQTIVGEPEAQYAGA